MIPQTVKVFVATKEDFRLIRYYLREIIEDKARKYTFSCLRRIHTILL